MESQGVFDSDLGIIGFARASSSLSTDEQHNFDYSASVLAEMLSGTKEEGDLEIRSKTLVIPQGTRTAHNLMNFGNFLWGASGYTVGAPLPLLLLGAQANSLGLFSNNNKRDYNGYSSQLDSIDDQISIAFGALFALRNNYRNQRK